MSIWTGKTRVLRRKMKMQKIKHYERGKIILFAELAANDGGNSFERLSLRFPFFLTTLFPLDFRRINLTGTKLTSGTSVVSGTSLVISGSGGLCSGTRAPYFLDAILRLRSSHLCLSSASDSSSTPKNCAVSRLM